MPGKVNPVLCETATQVSAQVIGNDAAIAFGGTQGQFELNVFIPMMARNVLESIKLLANTATVFAERLVDGLEANEEHMKLEAEKSPSIVTPLNSAIGYENAAKVAKTALAEGKTIRQTVIDLGFVPEKLSEEELDKRLDAGYGQHRPRSLAGAFRRDELARDQFTRVSPAGARITVARPVFLCPLYGPKYQLSHIFLHCVQ